MIEPSPNCFSIAATVLRRSALVSSTLEGLVPEDLAAFFLSFSLSLSLAMRVVAGAVVLGRWLVGAAVATMNLILLSSEWKWFASGTDTGDGLDSVGRESK